MEGRFWNPSIMEVYVFSLLEVAISCMFIYDVKSSAFHHLGWEKNAGREQGWKPAGTAYPREAESRGVGSARVLRKAGHMKMALWRKTWQCIIMISTFIHYALK